MLLQVISELNNISNSYLTLHTLTNYHLNPLKLYTNNPENLFLMKNKQLGNMASKVEMIHNTQCISSLCDSFWRVGGIIYYMEFKLLESNLLVVD